ncbi:hypothetical protein OG786_03170 [Streptomyces sp. NBC_00101]|uniref:hypothetical protein n=1 Tax=Streptomyces sp. NBC_00101 TaxID=2975651 RepID=UPI00324F533B
MTVHDRGASSTSAPYESHASSASPLPDILSPAFATDPDGVHRMTRDHAPLIRHEATNSHLVPGTRTSH